MTAPARGGFAANTPPVCAGAGAVGAPLACVCSLLPLTGRPGESPLPPAFAAFAPEGGLLPRVASVDGCLRFRFGAASVLGNKPRHQFLGLGLRWHSNTRSSGTQSRSSPVSATVSGTAVHSHNPALGSKTRHAHLGSGRSACGWRPPRQRCAAACSCPRACLPSPSARTDGRAGIRSSPPRALSPRRVLRAHWLRLQAERGLAASLPGRQALVPRLHTRRRASCFETGFVFRICLMPSLLQGELLHAENRRYAAKARFIPSGTTSSANGFRPLRACADTEPTPGKAAHPTSLRLTRARAAAARCRAPL